MLEYPVEVAGGVESSFVGDLLKGFPAVGIQLDGVCHPLQVQVLVEADTRIVQNPAEVAYGKAEPGGCFLNGRIVQHVLAQVLEDGLEAFVAGDDLCLQGDFMAGVHRGEQLEEGV